MGHGIFDNISPLNKTKTKKETKTDRQLRRDERKHLLEAVVYFAGFISAAPRQQLEFSALRQIQAHQ
jgi:hypothetical protein